MKRLFNILLFCALILLLYLCVRSIGGTVRFNDERATRERVIENQLSKIAHWQTLYRDSFGCYTASWDTLNRFVSDCTPGQEQSKIGYLSYPHRPMSVMLYDTLKNGVMLRSYRIEILYDDYLNGLDETQIKKLKQEAEENDLFPGITSGN